MAKSKINYWKWGVIAVIAILIFWSGCKYGSSGFGCNRPDTASVKIDTTIHEDKDSIVYVPVPYKVDSFIYISVPKKIITPGKNDTIQVPENVDTAEIINQFFSTSYYYDTVRFKRGWIAITDTISLNAIQGRKIVSSISDTTIRDTVILTQPKRTIGYFTLSAMGNKTNPAYAVGAGFTLKMKSDLLVGVKGKLAIDNKWFAEVEAGIPIRLNKKRNR